MLGLLRDRDFALLWAGQGISEVGSAVTYVALPLLAVLVLHASAFQVGLVTAATSIAWLVVALPAGVWVDRLPRRTLLIGSDAGRALLLASIPVAWSLHALSIGQLAAVAFLVGVLSVLFDVGYPAYLPSVIGRERLVEGNSALAASESAANVAGPSLGGVLVQAVGAPAALLADAASFLVSAVTLALMRADGVRPAAHPERRRLTEEIRAGLRYMWAHPLARTVAVAGILANFVLGGYQAVIVVFLARQVGLAPGVIGVLFTATAVGGLLGSIVAPALARRIGTARVLWAGPTVMAVCGLLVPLASKGAGVAWYLAGSLPASLGIAAFNVCVRAAMQAAAPDAMLGRLTASVRLFTRGATPVGALAAGALAGLLTPRATLAILMALLALTPAWLVLSPIGRVRDITQLAPDTAPPTAESSASEAGTAGPAIKTAS